MSLELRRAQPGRGSLHAINARFVMSEDQKNLYTIHLTLHIPYFSTTGYEEPLAFPATIANKRANKPISNG
eukprot:9472051-Pyramimonas_sp.AAC.5